MSYKCDICSAVMPSRESGFSFERNRVLASPGYWETFFPKNEFDRRVFSEEGMGLAVQQMLMSDTGYVVCANCKNMLGRDGDKAKEYRIDPWFNAMQSRGFKAKDRAQAKEQLQGTLITIGTVYERNAGKWPNFVSQDEFKARAKRWASVDQNTPLIANFWKKLFGAKSGRLPNKTLNDIKMRSMVLNALIEKDPEVMGRLGVELILDRDLIRLSQDQQTRYHKLFLPVKGRIAGAIAWAVTFGNREEIGPFISGKPEEHLEWMNELGSALNESYRNAIFELVVDSAKVRRASKAIQKAHFATLEDVQMIPSKVF